MRKVQIQNKISQMLYRPVKSDSKSEDKPDEIGKLDKDIGSIIDELMGTKKKDDKKDKGD